MIATQNGLVNNNSPSKKPLSSVAPGGTAAAADLASTSGANSNGASGKPINPNAISLKRIELEDLVKQFRELLGEQQWPLYYSILCKFLLGKESKPEFQDAIKKHFLTRDNNFKQKFIKFHNKFLLASLANAFRDPPNSNNVSNDGFGYLNTLSGKNKNKNPQKLNSNDVNERERLKKEIMSLTIKERKRIKNISKNTNPKITHISRKYRQGEVTQERFELLPKIPAGVPNHNNAQTNNNSSTNNNNNSSSNNNNSSISTNNKTNNSGKNVANGNIKSEQDLSLPDVSNKRLKGKNVNQLSIQVQKDNSPTTNNQNNKNLNLLQKSGSSSSLTPGTGAATATAASGTNTSSANVPNTPTSATTTNGGNVTTWTQEIMNGFQTLLSSESYELPDNNVLRSRMIGIMRENGLIGNLNDLAINIMTLGLENYLKNIVESAIDTVRYRKTRYDDTQRLSSELDGLDAINGSSDLLNADGVVNSEAFAESSNTINAINQSQKMKSSDSNNGTSRTPKTREEMEEIDRKRKITLCAEDIYDTIKLTPHIVEPNGMLDRISTLFLKDDDFYKFDTINNSGIVDLLPIGKDLQNYQRGRILQGQLQHHGQSHGQRRTSHSHIQQHRNSISAPSTSTTAISTSGSSLIDGYSYDYNNGYDISINSSNDYNNYTDHHEIDESFFKKRKLNPESIQILKKFNVTGLTYPSVTQFDNSANEAANIKNEDDVGNANGEAIANGNVNEVGKGKITSIVKNEPNDESQGFNNNNTKAGIKTLNANANGSSSGSISAPGSATSSQFGGISSTGDTGVNEKNEGTRDELLWLIHDLLA